jgi:putative inorganic carbon (HCO3(-)) transporter
MKNENTKKQWYEKAILWLIYSAIILVPAAFSPWFFTVFSAPKIFILRIITLGIIALFGCKWFVEGKITYKKSTWNIIAWIFAATAVITTMFSESLYTSLFGAEGRFVGLYTMLNLIVLSWLIFNAFEKEEILKLVKISFVTSSVLALYGLLQWAGVMDGLQKSWWGSDFIWSESVQERVFGTIGHGNHFGAYLAMGMMLGVACFMNAKKKLQKIIIALLVTLHLGVLLLTGSRGALAGLFGGIAVWLIFWTILEGKRITKWVKSTSGKLSIAIGVVLFLLVFVTGIWQKIPFVERTLSTMNFVSEGNIPDRLSWWYSTIDMIKEKPFFGHGLSTYRDIYNKYRRTDYTVNAPGDMQDLITPEAAHNEYLNTAATQGIIGLLAYLLVIGYVLAKSGKIIQSEKKINQDTLLLIGIYAAIVVYSVQVFVSFGVIATMFELFVLLGAALSFFQNHERVIKNKGPLSYAVTLGISVIVCCGLIFSLKEIAAEYYYQQGLVAQSKGDVENAIESFQSAVLQKPQGYAYLQGFGDFALKQSGNKTLKPAVQQKMLILAISNYEKALAINDHHPSVYFNLATAEFRLGSSVSTNGKSNTAMSHLSEAVKRAVNNPLYAYQSAKALMSLNNPEALLVAKDYLEKALNIRPSYRDAEQLLNQVNQELQKRKSATTIEASQ